MAIATLNQISNGSVQQAAQLMQELFDAGDLDSIPNEIHLDAAWAVQQGTMKPDDLARKVLAAELEAMRPECASNGCKVLDAIAFCAAHDLPQPEWLRAAFLARHTRVKEAEAGSWDEAFDRPYVLARCADRVARIQNAKFTTGTLACALLPLLAAAQVINPKVTQENIRQTICVSGWTKTVRPPTYYTDAIKQELVTAIGGDSKDYELDHIIPLAVGGHPKDPHNLQLQLWEGPDGAKAKDVVETRVKRLICTGHLTLAQGQQCFTDGWKTCPRH